MAVLVLADHDLGLLSPSTARVIGAVASLGPVDVLVLGEGVDQVVIDAAALAGVRTVRVSQDETLVGLTAEVVTPVLVGLAAEYSHIVASAGAVGRDVMPRLAAVLDVMPITDVTKIISASVFERPIYAGNAIETVESAQGRQVLTVRASAFEAVGKGGAATIEAMGDFSVKVAARFIAAHRTESDTPDLASAQIVVAGGQAVGSAEGFKLVAQLAEQLGAAVGATRAAVDLGYAPNDWQIGQSGKIIAPELYIAVGISGALQHLAGIAGARKIIAINSDAEAGLVKIADVALIGDLFTIVPQLIAELDRLGIKR